jgi:hypothetical protein
MSSNQVESLNQILTDVVANRKALANQVETQKQQVEIGLAQLVKFDTLISLLQVGLDSPVVLEAAATQEAANATISPIGAGAAANEAAALLAGQSAQVAVNGAQG